MYVTTYRVGFIYGGFSVLFPSRSRLAQFALPTFPSPDFESFASTLNLAESTSLFALTLLGSSANKGNSFASWSVCVV